jgi:hypothetical protein
MGEGDEEDKGNPKSSRELLDEKVMKKHGNVPLGEGVVLLPFNTMDFSVPY